VPYQLPCSRVYPLGAKEAKTLGYTAQMFPISWVDSVTAPTGLLSKVPWPITDACARRVASSSK
jgi:hypothetical protein